MTKSESKVVPCGEEAFDPRTITRPDESLLTYYLLVSACSLILFPIVFVPLFIRYKTLKYRFDSKGVSMSWGLLFHTEVYLTYRRVQDIHVTRNIVERWLGLAKVPIQTASGTSGATMEIVGIREAEALRDFLYARMRGARSDEFAEKAALEFKPEGTLLLQQIRDALRENRSKEGSQV